MLAVFAEIGHGILRDRVKASIAQARKEGRPHERPPSVAKYVPKLGPWQERGSVKVRFHVAYASAGPSVDRLAQELGARRGLDPALAVVRDGGAGRRG